MFLIGGRTKETPPVSVMLNSGDVLVMSGESRRCFHAVPRIMNQDAHDENVFPDGEHGFTASYLRSHRININVRQVH